MRKGIIENEWVICTDIQKELKEKGVCVPLQKIGRVANRYGLSKETGLGFKLYNRKLIDIILKEIKDESIETNHRFYRKTEKIIKCLKQELEDAD